MPKRKVTSAPWVPVPARAYTGKAPRARQHRAVGRLSAGAPRLHKSCRWRRPQSKGRSCRSGRARRDLRVRGGRGHLSERPGWPSGSPISRGSTVSMIAFGGRRQGLTGQVPGVAAGRSNVARLGARGASGRMPLPRAGHPTARAVLVVGGLLCLLSSGMRSLVTCPCQRDSVRSVVRSTSHSAHDVHVPVRHGHVVAHRPRLSRVDAVRELPLPHGQPSPGPVAADSAACQFLTGLARSGAL